MEQQNNSPHVVTTRTKLITKKTAFLLIFVLLLVGAGLVIWQKSSSKQSQPQLGQQSVRKPALMPDFTDRPPTIAEQADTINFKGDYAGAQKFLDDHITQSKDKKEQGNLYEEKSVLAFNSKKYDQALVFAQKAEALNSTGASLSLAAQAAEALNNKILAVDYYKKVLVQLPPSRPEEDRQDLRDKIKSLEAKP